MTHVGDHVARANGVRLDAQFAPLRRHRLDQHLDAALGDRVGRHRCAGQFRGERADVDHLAPAPLGHAFRGLAPDDEGSGQIDVEDAAPIGGLEFQHRLSELDAGVVDEDVDVDALRIQRLEGRDDRRLIRHVEGRCQHVVALIAHRLRGGLKPFLVDAIQDNARPGLREALGKGAAQTTRRAGDEGGLAGQIEQGMAHETSEMRVVRSLRSKNSGRSSVPRPGPSIG